MFKQSSKSVRVNVEPVYLEDESEPDRDYFLWAYTISIENQGDDVIQLRSRHWRITDRNGRVQEVRGDGVVGEQPVLNPGESFEYTSGVPLSTPSGIMVGAYVMETVGGDSFTVDIPAFSLDSPFDRHRVH